MGSVAVEPQQDTYEAGTEIKVSAVPVSEDYEFVGFTKRGTQEIVSKENPYVFQIQENMELTANFKEVEHSYLIYVESPDPQMGTVTMDPAFIQGQRNAGPAYFYCRYIFRRSI